MEGKTTQNNLYTAFYKSIVLIGFMALLLMGALLLKKEADFANASATRIRSGQNNETMRTATASTSPSGNLSNDFLANGRSSTTLEFDSDDIEEMTIAMQTIATGTVRSNITIQTFVGDGDDYFEYDPTISTLGTQTGDLWTSSTSPKINWQQSVTGTSTKAVRLAVVPGKKIKLTFGLASTTHSSTTVDYIGFYANVMGVTRRP